MSSLGWLLNLDFAGSGVGAPVGPAVGSLLLLGVGRMWWLPVLWERFTGRAYAGELDYAVQYAEPALYFFSGLLLMYAVYRLKEYLEARRRAKLPPPLVDDVKKATIVGHLYGPKRKCPVCGKERELLIYSDKHVNCEDCMT
ncbi:MAG: hypothetical protein ACE5JU_09950 [Candidatus Binatia bacterium]